MNAKQNAISKLTESGAMGAVPLQALAMRFDCDLADVQDQLDNFRDNAEALAIEAGLDQQAMIDAYSNGYTVELSMRRAMGLSVR